MKKLSPKENYLRLTTGECPEYVPNYTMMQMPGRPPVAAAMYSPSILGYFRGPEGGVDPWGVKYVTSESTNNAALPEPKNFLIKDITKWRDILKKPDYSHVDWEALAKKDLEQSGIDPTQTALIFGSQAGVFQDLMAFMGFTEGLCAMYEEPDEVKALFDFITDVYLETQNACMDYYKPDIYYILDDSANQKAPFVSLEMYREFLLPYYKKMAKPAIERGIPIQFHNCGQCTLFLDDMVNELGVKIWDPAQTMNDLEAIKKKYGNKLAIAGGWDFVVPSSWPDVDEEWVRSTVRDTIDRLAPGGGYAFCGAVLGAKGDEMTMVVNGWVQDEVEKYGADFYK